MPFSAWQKETEETGERTLTKEAKNRKKRERGSRRANLGLTLSRWQAEKAETESITQSQSIQTMFIRASEGWKKPWMNHTMNHLTQVPLST